jgi:hypothetical protein
MNQFSKLEVIDKDGWRNEFRLEKTIVHIGSDPRNDIVLERGRGGNVAPLHAQLILSASQRAPAVKASGCQLVNLGDTDIRLGLSADQTLPPRAVISLTHGAAFKLGEFTLIFHGDESPSDVLTSSDQRVGLSVSLPRSQLEPNRTLDGVITVRNLGDRGGVQIELDLEGLEPDCYDLEPGPILSSGAEREVFFRLHHRGHKPPAGDCPITIRATAPHAYPGDEVIVSQVVQVLPFYRHKLHLVPPAGVSPSLPAEEREESSVDAGLPQPQAEDGRRPRNRAGLPSVPGKGTGTGTGTVLEGEDWWTSTPEKDGRSEPARERRAPRIPQAELSIPPLAPAAQGAPKAEASASSSVAPERDSPAEIVPSSPTDMAEPETVAKAIPQLQGEEPQAEVETELSALSPPAELPIDEEQAPETEVAAPDQMADEGVTPVDSLQGEAEATSPEEQRTRTGAELPAQVTAGELPIEEEQAPEAEPAAAVQPEDLWWTTPRDPLRGTAEDGLEQHVLKLKASPPPEAQAGQTPIEAEPPLSAEDWWVPGAEVGPGEASDDRPVLKLKASPPPETEAEQMPDGAGPSPSAEDWWTPPAGPLLGEPTAGSGEESGERPVPGLNAGLLSETDVEQEQETEVDSPSPET